jgi:hypothetical protein
VNDLPGAIPFSGGAILQNLDFGSAASTAVMQRRIALPV